LRAFSIRAAEWFGREDLALHLIRQALDWMRSALTEIEANLKA
jgi:hypothetical protein